MTSQLKSKLISSYKEEMVAFLKSQPEYFNEAIKSAISADQPFAWRSAFYLSSCMEDNDVRVKKFIKPILACIKSKNDGSIDKICTVDTFKADSSSCLKKLYFCLSPYIERRFLIILLAKLVVLKRLENLL